MALTDKLTAIGNAIRQKTCSAELIPLSDMPNEIDSVYEAGYEKGKAEGGNAEEAYQQGVADGKRSEHDAFWDAFQQNGARTRYNFGFYGTGFNFDNFYPEHDIKPTGAANQMFCGWESGKHNFSLKQRLEDCGVVLDTSKATNLKMAFDHSWFTEIPTIDCTGLASPSDTSAVFANSSIYTKTIEKIVTKEDNTYSDWFNNARGLIDVKFEGSIGQNIDFKSCSVLSRASIKSIIEHLSDTASGKTLTLSKTAVENAFVDTDGEPAEISISVKQSDGFYTVDFEDSADRYSLLEFAVPMDISFYGAVLVDDVDLYTVDISRSGVYRLNMNEEVAATGPNGDSIDFSFAHLLGDGGQLKIKRTDGRDLSSGDVTAYLIGELNYEWFDLIATKPNWDIILI